LDSAIKVALARRAELNFHTGESAMQTLLLVLIVVLAGAICALAGYWFHRATEEHEHGARPPQFARDTSGDAQWEGAVRASHDKF
jgi:hypothetical protein